MLATNLNKNFTRVMLLVVAAGFAFLLVELLVMGHSNGPRLISVVAAALGAVFGLVAMSQSSGLRRIMAILFVVLSLSGIFGFMAHSNGRSFRSQAVASAPATEDRTVRRALNSFGNMPPTLAPLMLTGLSLFGAVVALSASAEATKKA